MTEKDKTIFSITAHIDLLGFSSHLILSSYDLRTKIGEEAIQRLRILENVTELIEDESNQCKPFYPESFRFLRFNDSLILGIDINPPIVPRIGRPNEGGAFTYREIEDFFKEGEKDAKITEKMQKHFNTEAFKVCQFIGLVSRIHNYINTREFDIHMPGCRTIISSGLRYKFIGKDQKEDFYSANFSLSNAFIVNEVGSKQGFTGNKCYIENNVGQICGYNQYSKRLIGFTKFIRNDVEHDPFNGLPESPLTSDLTYNLSKQIVIELFNKKYVFREINTVAASNLQLFPAVLNFIDKQYSKEDELLQNFISCIKTNTPALDAINSKTSDQILNHPHFRYPVLWLSPSFEEKITELTRQFEKQKS